MIAKLKPYPAYKDSGEPWLGDVPKHWDVKRQRHAVEMRVSNIDKHSTEGEYAVRLCNYVDVYKNDRVTERLPFMRATATREEIERFRLQAGDVLITKDSEAWNDIGVPALVEYTAPDLVCGYHLALLRPRMGLHGSYLLRALQSPGLAYQFHVAATGVTRYGLSHEAIKSVLLPLPPLPEQAAIVRFLDHADRRVRRYINAKRKLIALLNEQRQAIIHRAVTRGLDANVRLKASGVEWLGDVPEHWEIITLGAAAKSIQTGPFGSQLHASDYMEGGTPVINPSHLRDGVLRPDDRIAVTEAKANELERHRLEVGDIVMARRGELGRCGLTTDEGAGWLCGTGSLRVRCSTNKFEPEYLVELLSSSGVRDALTISSIGATMDNLNAGMISRLRLPCPPLDEQAAILAESTRQTSAIDAAVARPAHEIDLLREYRTRLIADVVTGKLDVREAAATLPDEADEPEKLDDAELDDEDEVESVAEEDAAALEEVEA